MAIFFFFEYWPTMGGCFRWNSTADQLIHTCATSSKNQLIVDESPRMKNEIMKMRWMNAKREKEKRPASSWQRLRIPMATGQWNAECGWPRPPAGSSSFSSSSLKIKKSNWSLSESFLLFLFFNFFFWWFCFWNCDFFEIATRLFQHERRCCRLNEDIMAVC